MFKMLFGINLNCWFCNQYTKVSLFSQNSWICSHCDQYNGFDKNGDYNREIPEMHHQSKRRLFTLPNKPNVFDQKNSYLCERCSNHQKLKIEKISNFEPKREETSDLEMQLYKEYMEKIYDLCDTCKSKVKFEITRQDGILKQYLYKMGKFDYLFERNVLGKQLSTLRTTTISQNSKLVSWMKIFLFSIVLILSMATISFNDYSNNDLFKNFLNFFPPISEQNQQLISNISSLINISKLTRLNNQIPLFIVLSYILLCSSLILESENFKRILCLLGLNTILIISNYHTIFQSLNFSQNASTCMNLVPVCSGLMILILISEIKNVKFMPEVNSRPKLSHQGAIIPNLNNKINQQDKVIKPAKFKPVSKSLFDFKPARASVDSSDFTLNASRSVDDDSSSIVSGLTNLYLDRTRDIDQNIKKEFGLMQCIESNGSSFYQCLRNRSIVSSKWHNSCAQANQFNKKEIYVVY